MGGTDRPDRLTQCVVGWVSKRDPPHNRRVEEVSADMTGFIVRRVISSFLVVILTSMFVFALFFLGPSNPARNVCEAQRQVHRRALALIEEQMGSTRVVVTSTAPGPRASSSTATITIDGELRLPRAVPRHLVQHPRTGHRRLLEVPRHPVARHRRRDDLPDARRAPRRAGGAMARHRGRPAARGRQRCWSPRSRTTWSRCWRGSTSSLQLEHLPGHRLLPDHREPGAVVSLAAAALAGASALTNSTSYARFTRGQMVETLERGLHPDRARPRA